MKKNVFTERPCDECNDILERVKLRWFGEKNESDCVRMWNGISDNGECRNKGE